ncbi:hypothetical protein PFDG_04609 [Plasmodium falciparum Dd2]|uniref:Helicase C-terminal domain-containing protein n=1 Tax=Plasmodium falciparum (isolate Dd2) TaxID=57267 RepID=A0A0L7M5L9_PLAF4|nr:hypothetical protein PFDG_04609 [Plasmodium falciparum Dd2]
MGCDVIPSSYNNHSVDQNHLNPHLKGTLESPVLLNVEHCFITINNENLTKKEELKYKMKVVYKIINDIKYNQCFLFINNTYEGIQVIKMLKKMNVPSYYTSSKIEHKERIQLFKSLQENKVKIVVCTDVMSRGIDNIVCDLVINFDIPQSKETYVHRSGRCGRFGNKGLCVSLCNYTDYNYLYYFKYKLKLNVCDFYYICKSDHRKQDDSSVQINNIKKTHEHNEQIIDTHSCGDNNHYKNYDESGSSHNISNFQQINYNNIFKNGDIEKLRKIYENNIRNDYYEQNGAEFCFFKTYKYESTFI